METSTQIIDDLNVILSLINNTKDSYSFSAEITRSAKLRTMFTTFAIRRMLYAAELKTLIDNCGGKPNIPIRITDTFYRTWVNFKQILIGKHDEDIIDSLIAEEVSLIEKYNNCIRRHQHQQNNMSALIKQRDGIEQAINEIGAMATVALY